MNNLFKKSLGPVRRSFSAGGNFVSALCISVFSLVAFCNTAYAQQNAQSYEFSFAPDLWYNSVDGIRVGIRVRGKVPGTFEQGPHRLDAGLWLATFFPEYPVSYYISFTEPIPAISGFKSEGNIRLRSSIRTGYHWHQISLNKRWQPGFEVKNYYSLSVYLRALKRFDEDYRLYPEIWQDEWLGMAGASFSIHNDNAIGRYEIRVHASANLIGNYPSFGIGRLTLEQFIPLSDYFILRGRLFLAASTENTAPEFRFTRSFRPYFGWMRDGSTRAKGTIPEAWVTGGIIHVSGGANLRGYTNYDIELLNSSVVPLYTSAAAMNIELDYPNPLDEGLEKIPVVGGLLDFRTYLFFDAGLFNQVDREQTFIPLPGANRGRFVENEGDLIADAGPGFALSLRIPDYLGKVRGFTIRYEIPIWLSHPQPGVSNFAYRSIIGVGAVISL